MDHQQVPPTQTLYKKATSGVCEDEIAELRIDTPLAAAEVVRLALNPVLYLSITGHVPHCCASKTGLHLS